MAKTLAVIYRPKKFEDVCEQKNVIGILQNQLASGECKNAYLFSCRVWSCFAAQRLSFPSRVISQLL